MFKFNRFGDELFTSNIQVVSFGCYHSTTRHFYVDQATKVKVVTRYYRNDTEESEFSVIRSGQVVAEYVY